MVKNLQETRVRSLGEEDYLEKGMATHSSILAWRISWTEEPGGLVHGVTRRQTRLSDYYLKLSDLTTATTNVLGGGEFPTKTVSLLMSKENLRIVMPEIKHTCKCFENRKCYMHIRDSHYFDSYYYWTEDTSTCSVRKRYKL